MGHSLTACNACKIQNGSQGAPKWPTGSRKVFGRSGQLSLNMRKGRNRGEKKTVKKREKNDELRHCQQSTVQMPTDWNAARLCLYNMILYQ